MIVVKIPKSVMLELTYKCNHRCKFCYCPWENYENHPLYGKQDELTAANWLRVVTMLKALGIERIGLSGGEPLSKEGLFDLLRHIRDNGLQVVLITNGIFMNEGFISVFKEIGSSLLGIGLSLPGIATYSYHTGTESNNSEKVLYWIRRLSEEGITVHLNVTATLQNLHELSDIITKGFVSGAKALSLSRFVVGGRGSSFRDELSLSDEGVIQTLDIAERTLRMIDQRGVFMSKLPLCALPADRQYKRLRIGGVCGAARKTFTIDPSGYIRVCVQSAKRVGHIFSDDIVEVETVRGRQIVDRPSRSVCRDG